ncbi:MAG: MFS transporter [Anaerolineaceae bacterium]|nr:MFS transporter [Anaerolineaceae bacterium]
MTSHAEPTNIEKLRGLRWSIAGDAANTVFVQFTFFGSVFILFLDALGLSKTEIGLLLSFFPFAGLIALPIAPRVARFGFKRTFLTFWGVRKIFTACLLLTPLVVNVLGAGTAVVFIGLIVALFALCRAIAETGKFPWVQEYVPNQVRGKFAATGNLITTIVGIVSVAAAGYVITHSEGLGGFMLLIAIGVLVGLVGVWAYSFIPGGAPTAVAATTQERDLKSAVGDRNFRNYLIGAALITLGTVPMTSFLPLFMSEEVGLADGQVVLLQNGVLVGSLLFGYVWGWAADRYGSMPVMLSGLALRLALPLGWLFMPKNSPLSLLIALGIALVQGISNMGWGIGSGRLFFVSVVPPEMKTDYTALHYAWVGVIGGLSQLLGGWILDISQGFSTRLDISPYALLFILGLVLPLISLRFFHGVARDTRVTMGTFAGFFLRGNPFVAVESMIRYHLAKDEETTVRLTERLGQARSLLAVEELLEALDDPRFNVRFEAIVAIGRTRPDEQLIEALAEVLHSSDPSLSVMAAWALGRIRDDRARATLHAALDSEYRSIRAHSARSLGTLGDETAVPDLLHRLQTEPDHGLRIAYASALGQLQVVEAVPHILELLRGETDAMLRRELALALARLTDEEHAFVRLLRQTRTDTGTALAQALLGLTRRWPQNEPLQAASNAFAHENLTLGVAELVRFLQAYPVEELRPYRAMVLQECAARLHEEGSGRLEYVLLALHVLSEVQE